MDEIRDNFHAGKDQAQQAFDELYDMVQRLQGMKTRRDFNYASMMEIIESS